MEFNRMPSLRLLLALPAAYLTSIALHAQTSFEITIPVPGLTNVAGGQPLPDGGFVFGGELNDGVVVVRTDSTGAVLWTRALAEAANEEGIYDRSIAVSGDRIYMGGYAMGPGTSTRDGILHVLDFDGDVISQRLIDVAGGGMALVGYGDDVGGPAPSAYLVKTDAAGQELWSRGLDGASADEGYSVMEDAATGDLYIGGRTLGMGTPGTRGFISKFNSSGDHQWTRVINNAFDVIGMTASAGRLIALARAQDILLGHGNYDAVLLAFDANGQFIENRLYGSTASEYPVSLARTAQNGLLVTSFKGTPGNAAIHAVLTDGLFNGACTGISVQAGWATHQPNVFPHSSTQQSGQSLSSWVTPFSEPALQRGFVCCTFPSDAGFTMEATGDPLTWTFTATSPAAISHEWNLDGTTYTVPSFTHTFSTAGAQLVCLSVQGICDDASDCEVLNVSSTDVREWNDQGAFRIWPNPAQDAFRIEAAGITRPFTLAISDATGRAVMHLQALPGDRISTAGLLPGIYLVQLRSEGSNWSQRLVLH